MCTTSASALRLLQHPHQHLATALLLLLLECCSLQLHIAALLAG
jgi:Fe2+ transport system protein B